MLFTKGSQPRVWMLGRYGDWGYIKDWPISLESGVRLLADPRVFERAWDGYLANPSKL